MSPRGSFGLASSANLKPYLRSIEYSQSALTASRNRLTASSGWRHASVSVPSRPPHSTQIFAPGGPPGSSPLWVFGSGKEQPRDLGAVKAPPENAASKNGLPV